MSFTNQMLGALGTATGALAAGEHIAEQKQQKAISSLGQYQTAIDQEAEAERMNDDALVEQMKFEKENPNLSDEDGLNQKEIERLKEQDAELSKKMLEEHPRNEQGRFISKMEHQFKVAEQQSNVNKDLEAAWKARDVLNMKLAVREKLKTNVKTREKQLKVAKENTTLAMLNLEKQKKYLPKGPKGGNK